jgi:putative aldouronate transport system substrate-binding protein
MHAAAFTGNGAYCYANAPHMRTGLKFGNHMSRMLQPFPASAGGPLQAMMGPGYIALNALKKASPDRIKELLRILNYLASPFGSQEDLLLSYGLKDQDYTSDAKGNPFPTADGLARSQFVPWQYIARRPHVDYQADLPGFVKTSFEAQKFLMPAATFDPTLGYHSPTAYTKGATADISRLC